MRVRCISTKISDELARQFGDEYFSQRGYADLDEGREYVVYGLRMTVGSANAGASLWVDVMGDLFDWPISVPLGMFEVVDSRVSRHWVLTVDDGDVTLQPPSFAKFGYFSLLVDRDPDVVADFEQISRLLGSEFSSDLLREVIRGDKPLDVLAMTGVFVKRHWSTWSVFNTWQVNTTIGRQDLAQGLLAYSEMQDSLDVWASLLLDAGLVKLDLGDLPDDDALLAAVWDASGSGNVSPEVIKMARRVAGQSA